MEFTVETSQYQSINDLMITAWFFVYRRRFKPFFLTQRSPRKSWSCPLKIWTYSFSMSSNTSSSTNASSPGLKYVEYAHFRLWIQLIYFYWEAEFESRYYNINNIFVFRIACSLGSLVGKREATFFKLLKFWNFPAVTQTIRWFFRASENSRCAKLWIAAVTMWAISLFSFAWSRRWKKSGVAWRRNCNER